MLFIIVANKSLLFAFGDVILFKNVIGCNSVFISPAMKFGYVRNM